jgi:hypothetical protein
MSHEVPRQICEKNLDTKFYQKPSSGSRVVPYGKTDRPPDRQTDRQTNGRTDGRTDMIKLITTFRNFANAP